jgi:hypothetical protein
MDNTLGILGKGDGAGKGPANPVRKKIVETGRECGYTQKESHFP